MTHLAMHFSITRMIPPVLKIQPESTRRLFTAKGFESKRNKDIPKWEMRYKQDLKIIF